MIRKQPKVKTKTEKTTITRLSLEQLDEVLGGVTEDVEMDDIMECEDGSPVSHFTP